MILLHMTGDGYVLHLVTLSSILAATSPMCTRSVFAIILSTDESMPFLRVVLHRTQSSHDIDRICLSGDFLKFWIVNAHEYIVLLVKSAEAP